MNAVFLILCVLCAIASVDSFRLQTLKKFIAVPFVALSFASGALGQGIGADSNDLPEGEIVPSQLVKFDKIDINNSPISDYKPLPGMYPHAAGQIASHGPYKSVDDLQKIPTATEADKKLFKKYKVRSTTSSITAVHVQARALRCAALRCGAMRCEAFTTRSLSPNLPNHLPTHRFLFLPVFLSLLLFLFLSLFLVFYFCSCHCPCSYDARTI
jgi:hypothetical protein